MGFSNRGGGLSVLLVKLELELVPVYYIEGFEGLMSREEMKIELQADIGRKCCECLAAPGGADVLVFLVALHNI